MALYKDFSFWVMLAKNISAAGNLACLIGIIIFGSAVLEDYDTLNCKIGAGTNDESVVDVHNYKLATQLLFIFTIVASFMYAPHNHKNVRWQYAFATLLSMGLVISAFLAGYAGITTNCNSDDIKAIMDLRMHNNTNNSTDVVVTAMKTVLRAYSTPGSKSMGASFLSFGAILGMASHDLFNKRGDIHFAISHWPAWMDTIFRIIAFSMITHFLNDEANYVINGSNVQSAQCIAELDMLKDSDHGNIIPYKHSGMYKLAFAAAIIGGIELLFKGIELVVHRLYEGSSGVTKFAYFNRTLTMFSRVCVGIFVFGFIIANQLIMCQPYEITTYFKGMIGMLLSCYFSGFLQTMLVGHGNMLVIFGEGPSQFVTSNKYSTKTSPEELEHPLLMGF